MHDTELADINISGNRAVQTVSLTVNGEQHRTAAPTLAELMAGLGYGAVRVATAVNGDFVPERMRATHRLAAGDAIEIVAPRQGG
jgi:sulfur carrier protein